MRFILRVLINAVALWVAARLVREANLPAEDLLNAPAAELWQLLGIALIFGVLNAAVRPILDFLTCPAYVLTLGLFTFVMNMFILYLLEVIANWLFGETVVVWGSWWNMFVAGIIVTLVSFALNMLLGDRKR